MINVLNTDFLKSIVCLENFKLNKQKLEIELVCIEEGEKEVLYRLDLFKVNYFVFRQEDVSEDFSVIDTFVEKFNECQYVDFMKSEKWKEFWILRFHSGIHHLVVGFNSLNIIQSNK